MSAEETQIVPKEVLELVERFERDRHVYQSTDYTSMARRMAFCHIGHATRAVT